MTLAWNAQHGCGGNASNDPHNLQCNIVIQYTCDADHTDKALAVALRNGANTDTPNAEANNIANVANVQAANDAANRGRHESEYWYYECANRSRNKGLFTADQKLNGDTAIYTRQNAGGGRSGLECAEERDYYPYWTPTPWRDVAYLTSEIGNTNIDICKLVKEESQNVKDKYKCTGVTYADVTAEKINPITEAACTAASGTWKKYDSFKTAAPDCRGAEWTRDNHLGNTREGQYHNYTWTLPTWDELINTQKFKPENTNFVKCVARIRYNITTGDYDPWNTFAQSNNDKNVISNNPTLDLGADSQGLQLALNTAQTGRTFQDRTHIFTIRKRPATGAPFTAATKIYNLNTIGKRGNIVQTFPSVEYMFMPNLLRVTTADFIHVQWTGSNTHNNGGGGGDGQTGDDGQGQGGTDRINLVLTQGEGFNWPIALDKADDHMWKHTKCYVPDNTNAITDITTTNWVDCALIFATSGKVRSVAGATAQLNAQLNDAPPSLINGVLIRITKPGTYYYISSRNNNFTNRSQKGVIIVSAPTA